jgi:hypothetical protein
MASTSTFPRLNRHPVCRDLSPTLEGYYVRLNLRLTPSGARHGNDVAHGVHAAAPKMGRPLEGEPARDPFPVVSKGGGRPAF